MTSKEYCAELDRNVEVFKQTYKASLNKFKSYTEKMILNTDVYEDAANISIDVINKDMRIRFVNSGTVNAAYKIKIDNSNKRVAMLNFADAKRPGGWVTDGAPTQEENICRCTNTYVGLIQDKCWEQYYSVNDVYHTDAHLNEAYTDALIYLPDVVIFKDDSDYSCVKPVFVDVITSPAPCGVVKTVRRVLTHRIEGIIKSAYVHEVTDIVLGAWGCGAFGQNPKVVAESFAEVLLKYPIFDSVVFAIKDTPGIETSNARSFENAFLHRYKV